MKTFKDVLRYLSNKQWNLVDDYKEKIEKVISKSLTKEEEKQIKNYTKFIKEPLTFLHDLTTYKTGRIFAQYVLFPNKDINELSIKELIVPEKDYLFVSFDYSASQIRHLAVYKQIKWLIELFNQDNYDIYESFATRCGISRKVAKTALILLLYGGDYKTLMEKFDLSEEKAKLITKHHNEWFNLEEYDYQAKAQLSRKIQSIEVEFIKEKMTYIFNKQDNTHRLHAVLHDEIVLEIHKDHLDMIPKILKFLEKHPKIKMKVKANESKNFKFK